MVGNFASSQDHGMKNQFFNHACLLYCCPLQSTSFLYQDV